MYFFVTIEHLGVYLHTKIISRGLNVHSLYGLGENKSTITRFPNILKTTQTPVIKYLE